MRIMLKLVLDCDADAAWRMIHEHKVNLLFFTGDAMARPLLDALLAHQDAGNEYDLSSLFLLASTAALFSTSLKEKFLELLPNRVITDSIGSSETGFGGTSIVAKGQSHTGGPRVTIDKNTKVLDEDGNEVVPGFQFLPFTYTITLAPAESYDALVFVADATPTTLLPPS